VDAAQRLVDDLRVLDEYRVTADQHPLRRVVDRAGFDVERVAPVFAGRSPPFAICGASSTVPSFGDAGCMAGGSPGG
jgi:hypothetical protein